MSHMKTKWRWIQNMEVGFRQQEPRILIDTIALKKKTEKKKTERKKEKEKLLRLWMNMYVTIYCIFFWFRFTS